MKRRELITHLISEISEYILESDPMRMVISLHQEEDGLHLSVMDDAEHSDEEIERMERDLNSQKRPELSGYYGAMTDHSFMGTARLSLLGWQVKHTDITRIDKGIKIDFWLGGDRFDSRKFTIPDNK